MALAEDGHIGMITDLVAHEGCGQQVVAATFRCLYYAAQSVYAAALLESQGESHNIIASFVIV